MNDLLDRFVAAHRERVQSESGALLSWVPEGDYLSVFFCDEPYYADSVDDFLTAYRSLETQDLIGCKIKGLSCLAMDLQHQIAVVDGDVELRLVLQSAMDRSSEADSSVIRRWYYDLEQRAVALHLRVPRGAFERRAG
jgi:hypothetical protein